MIGSKQHSSQIIEHGSDREELPRKADWRQRKWLAMGELLVVALIFVADVRHLIPFSKTPFLLAFACFSLWMRKVRWRSFGLRIYRSWRATLVGGVIAGFLLEGFELFVSQPLLVKYLGKQPDLESFRMLTGNLKITLISIGWFGRWRRSAKRWCIAVT